MRAFVIGASGQVGAALLRALAQRGHDATGTYGHHPAGDLAQLDITDHAAVGRTVAAARPDWVFCPAGLTHVDRSEEHPDEAFATTATAPLPPHAPHETPARASSSTHRNTSSTARAVRMPRMTLPTRSPHTAGASGKASAPCWPRCRARW